MYLEYFGLKKLPFATVPDFSFYYPSSKHREALACLLYAVREHKGFALLTGEVGTGKTMICRAALDRLADKVEKSLIVHTLLSPKQFVQAVCDEFHLPTRRQSKVELLSTLRDFLLERRHEGQTVVLMVDEAQDLSFKVLEEVRLLGNLETANEKLIQIVLIGQPELRRLIGTPQLRQLDQRITVKFHLGSLAQEDVEAYIDHRLRLAGAESDGIFEPEAKLEVFKASKGIPRLVNLICDQVLLQAYIKGEPSVNPDTVRSVVAEREGYYMDRPAHAYDNRALWGTGG